MKPSRPLVIALMALVLLHQLVAGVFGGGTVLCVSATNGLAIQPAGMTCCTTHTSSLAAIADSCCPDDAAEPCAAVSATTCAGCTDYVLRTQPAPLPAGTTWLGMSPTRQMAIALLAWPAMPSAAGVTCRWFCNRTPPPLAFLRTTVLRC